MKSHRLVTDSGKRAEKEIPDVQRDIFSNWQVFPNPHDFPPGIKAKKTELPRIHPLAAQPHLTSIVSQVIPFVKENIDTKEATDY